jgi:hypothetical protein
MLVITSQTKWCQYKRQQLNLGHRGILRFYICYVVSLVVRLQSGGFKGFMQAAVLSIEMHPHDF